MTADLRACTAFLGTRRLAAGRLDEVALAARSAPGGAALLVFDDATGRVIDLDLRGSEAEILARLAPPAEPPTRGRPRLGVVAREVTLLPRHWEWLAAQPGGASVALRKLVEAASRDGQDAARRRAAQDATYRFATAIAGDEAGYEAAMRALYAADHAGFEAATASWPADIRDHASTLAAASFAPT